ncbi:uncharacterized protein KY384_008901 [Bacidia gigantensis]|uniref:uncharacterized protein n=1 Tax=Bacidia gigantensis TaxID=2732470 RepID=UPI001D04F195|nr:uncharacterized protein KY384_008901 [Bacidia gigantensis]KAG8525257.1 hypothetical protein KY384_008901 [Bacidia gigantensis]
MATTVLHSNARPHADPRHVDPSGLTARLTPMMNSGETQSISIEHQRQQPTIGVPHYPTHTRTPSASTASTTASTSEALPTPPNTASRSQAPHIRFRGASDAHPQHVRNDDPGTESSPQPPLRDGQQTDIPPPSPRLQPTYSTLSLSNQSLANSPSKIRVRDLGHIQSFASEDLLTRSRHPSRHSLRGRIEGGQQYEISSMPVADIIEMVAGLLTKITTNNDLQHEHLQRHVPPDGSSSLTPQASSVLAFHGKNVPSITIASYLMRIHKYCPTTYEVFLSLLIYFDRMTSEINKESQPTFAEAERRRQQAARTGSTDSSATVRPDDEMSTSPSPPRYASPQRDPYSSTAPGNAGSASNMHDYDRFVVDSFNIHRLVMAGVTCASKFFSDVFYTNSRYAKVGGLPLVELNHLEIQFLLLNDFRLSIPIEELEAYGTLLVEFYAEEIVKEQQAQQQPLSPGMRSPGDGEGIYMRMPASP